MPKPSTITTMGVISPGGWQHLRPTVRLQHPAQSLRSHRPSHMIPSPYLHDHCVSSCFITLSLCILSPLETHIIINTSINSFHAAFVVFVLHVVFVAALLMANYFRRCIHPFLGQEEGLCWCCTPHPILSQRRLFTRKSQHQVILARRFSQSSNQG